MFLACEMECHISNMNFFQFWQVLADRLNTIFNFVKCFTRTFQNSYRVFESLRYHLSSHPE